MKVVMSRARILALAALAVPLVACGDDDPTGFAQCTADAGIVTLTLSGGAQPVLNWDPACSVALLLIEEAGVRDLWHISTFREDESVLLDPAQVNLITPPVTYGVMPTGVRRIWGPQTLTSGVLQVLLQRVLENGRGWERFGEANCVISGNSVCVIVLHDFTR